MAVLICFITATWSAVSVAGVVLVGRSTSTEATTRAVTATATSTHPRRYQTGFTGSWAMMPSRVKGSLGSGLPRGGVGHGWLPIRPPAAVATPSANVWMVVGSRL